MRTPSSFLVSLFIVLVVCQRLHGIDCLQVSGSFLISYYLAKQSMFTISQVRSY